MHDATYLAHPSTAAALYLQRAGQWDLALTQAEGFPEIRAEILAERFFWQNVGVDEAIAAARALDSASLRDVLLARISYFHKLFQLKNNPLEIDELAVFSSTEGAWAAFWSGVVLDNVYERPLEAQAAYARARSLMGEDPYLESYVVRHEAFHLIETDRAAALAGARRSLALRASLGARPQVAAAQIALTHILPEGDPEVAELKALAHRTAEELNLPWLKAAE